MLTTMNRAGGGGKTKQRTAKIAEKNSKLQEEVRIPFSRYFSIALTDCRQRSRRIQTEEKLKAEKRESGSTGVVHPSRRGRLGLD